MPAHVLGEQGAAVRGAPDVHGLRSREEEHVPARLVEAVAPVGLLAEHEEVLVEMPDLVGRVAADEQASAEEPVDLPHLVVVEAARVEGVQHARPRRQLAEKEVLGREPPQRRKRAGRALQRPVRIEEPRADDGGIRMLIREPGKLLEAVTDHPGVGVQ